MSRALMSTAQANSAHSQGDIRQMTNNGLKLQASGTIWNPWFTLPSRIVARSESSSGWDNKPEIASKSRLELTEPGVTLYFQNDEIQFAFVRFFWGLPGLDLSASLRRQSVHLRSLRTCASYGGHDMRAPECHPPPTEPPRAASLVCRAAVKARA
jgi:hypothetical protein